MTGRLPQRHGLHRPPMYGEPGGLEGEVTVAELLSQAGYVTQCRRQVAHGRERRLAAPELRLRRLLRLPLRLRHVHRVARCLLLPGDRLQRRAHGVGEEPAVQQVLRPRGPRRRDGERGGGDDPGALASWTTSGATTRSRSSSGWPARRSRGSSTTTPAAPTSTTTRTNASSASHRPSHPYKDTLIELDDIVGRLSATLQETGQAENTLIWISSDNGPEMETWPDAAYTPFRCAKGSTWEGGVRVPADLPLARHDRTGAGKRRPPQLQRLPADRARPGRRRGQGALPTASSTGSTRHRSCWRRRGSPTASTTTTGWAARSRPCASASTSS